MSEHLDLDALADVLADGARPVHLESCAACQHRLSGLIAAMPAVSLSLSTLPVPEEPAAFEQRLLAAVASEVATQPTTGATPSAADATASSGTADVLPMVHRRSRWFPALGAVAAAAVLVTGGVLLTQHGPKSTTTTATGASSPPPYVVSSSGTDYTEMPDSLPAALPALLSGLVPARAGDVAAEPAPTGAALSKRASGPPAPEAQMGSVTADALAALRTTSGLARCLASLTDPANDGLPLALDYASFKGTPALVVVLPSSTPGKVDVFVVPAGCAQPDGQVLYFTRLPRPRPSASAGGSTATP